MTVFPTDSVAYKQVSEAMRLAFSRVGTDCSIDSYPAERAAQMFMKGFVDGDATRAEGFRKIFPQAIMIDPALFSIDFVGATYLNDIKLTSWADLAHYRIAVKRGYKVIEANTETVPGRQIVDSDHACIALLKANRADVCVGLMKEIGYSDEVKRDGRLKIVKFAEVDAHLYLGPKHQELATRISSVLADMKQHGELARIFWDQ
ncbi:MAG: transporter substrate-binding domain-containing protein [Burkholderiales bacterium]|nr:transporter substrate-binding domain-containing protein [Burkholderiales bacterium]